MRALNGMGMIHRLEGYARDWISFVRQTCPAHISYATEGAYPLEPAYQAIRRERLEAEETTLLTPGDDRTNPETRKALDT